MWSHEADCEVSTPIEKSFRDWEAHVFGYGYGSGESHIMPSIKTFMANVGRDFSDRCYDYEKLESALGGPTTWLLINALCHADMIEYGTSPRAGWLTTTGEKLRDFVASKTADELYEIVCNQANDDEFRCAPDSCNCGPTGWREGKCANPFWDDNRPWLNQAGPAGATPGEAKIVSVVHRRGDQ